LRQRPNCGRRDSHTGSAFVTVSTAASIMGRFFHASAVFPQDAVTIDGENTRLRWAVFFLSPLAARPFSHATADEIEVNLGSLDAPDQLMPTYESWIVRRESWLPPFPLTRRYERDRDAHGSLLRSRFARTVRRRRDEVTEMYALIEISNQMLEDSAFDHAGRWAWQVAPSGLAQRSINWSSAPMSHSQLRRYWACRFGHVVVWHKLSNGHVGVFIRIRFRLSGIRRVAVKLGRSPH